MAPGNDSSHPHRGPRARGRGVALPPRRPGVRPGGLAHRRRHAVPGRSRSRPPRCRRGRAPGRRSARSRSSWCTPRRPRSRSGSSARSPARACSKQRRHRRHALLVAAAAVLLVAAGIGGGWMVWRLRGRPGTDSPLLEDFGAGIRIASAARVGVSSRAVPEDEIEVPLDRPSPAGAGGARRQPGPPARPRALRRGRARARAGRWTAATSSRRSSTRGRSRRRSPGSSGRSSRASARRRPARPSSGATFPSSSPSATTAGWSRSGSTSPACATARCAAASQRALEGWRFDTFPGQRPTVSLAFRIGQ